MNLKVTKGDKKVFEIINNTIPIPFLKTRINEQDTSFSPRDKITSRAHCLTENCRKQNLIYDDSIDIDDMLKLVAQSISDEWKEEA